MSNHCIKGHNCKGKLLNKSFQLTQVAIYEVDKNEIHFYQIGVGNAFISGVSGTQYPNGCVFFDTEQPEIVSSPYKLPIFCAM